MGYPSRITGRSGSARGRGPCRVIGGGAQPGMAVPPGEVPRRDDRRDRNSRQRGLHGSPPVRKPRAFLGFLVNNNTPSPLFLGSADSKRVAGAFFVSADSKGIISPVFPTLRRGVRKC
jgi:hypothetical protein